jgi:hypothetical protein
MMYANVCLHWIHVASSMGLANVFTGNYKFNYMLGLVISKTYPGDPFKDYLTIGETVTFLRR